MAEDVKDSYVEVPNKRPRLENLEPDDDRLQDLGVTCMEKSDNPAIEEEFFPENNVMVNANNMDAINHGTDIPTSEADQSSTSKQEENGENCNDDESSSDISELSNMSGLSEEAWKSTAGSMAWIQEQMMLGQNPRTILNSLIPDDTVIPDSIDDFTLWKIVVNILAEPPKREKLTRYNTIEDALQLINDCQKIIVLTGAGVSVSCGIPDFRSRNGVYARLAVDFPNLPDPQAMFDIKFFKNDQRPFFKFAKEIYPGQFEPSKSHKFIQLIEKQGKLLRNYTQNIDTLEQVAGIQNIIQCHGSFARATCMSCKVKVDADEIREDIFNQVIPQCKVCPSGTEMAVMKPDIVFFGESLPEEFHNQMTQDKDLCDLLIVIGSSLKVRPVALIPNSLPPSVPQILINREPLKHLNFDIELLGDCDVIVSELCHRLGGGWETLSTVHDGMEEISSSELPTPPLSPSRTPNQELSSEPMYKSDSSSNNHIPPAQQLVASTSKCTGNEPTADSNTTDNLPHVNCNTNSTNGSSDSIKVSESQDSYESPFMSTSKVKPVMENMSDINEAGTIDEAGTINEVAESISESVGPPGNKQKGKDEEDMKLLRMMWHPTRTSIAKQLKENQYLFLPPNRYVFPGAEVFSITREEGPAYFACSISSSSSSCSSNGDGPDDSNVNKEGENLANEGASNSFKDRTSESKVSDDNLAQSFPLVDDHSFKSLEQSHDECIVLKELNKNNEKT